MPRGDKSSYTDKQKRKADHIEEGYEKRGVGKKESERRAWATVNKESGGGNKSGSGRGRKDTKVSARKGGKLGGRAAAARPDLRVPQGPQGLRPHRRALPTVRAAPAAVHERRRVAASGPHRAPDRSCPRAAAAHARHLRQTGGAARRWR